MKLKFMIEGQELRMFAATELAADTVNYLGAEFVFRSQDWSGLSKWAHFSQGDMAYDVPITEDQISESSGLNLTAGEWAVYLHGDLYENNELKQRITTKVCSFLVEESGCLEGSAFPSVAPDLTADLIARVESLEKSSAAAMEPAEDDLPKVFIDGTIPTTKEAVPAELCYRSKTRSFHAYITIKCQGSSSMDYPKKNFTIQLYEDESRENKWNQSFRDWGDGCGKYVLKANYVDHSHARNIVSARLWDQVVSSRNDADALPAEMKASPRMGAIDGFPVKVYTNGSYQGIYTWNIGKNAWMWNMDEENENHVLLCAETNTDGVFGETACNFRALWDGTDGTDWSVEVGTNSEAVKNSLNALISCVKDTDDETFKAVIGQYLDVQSAMDYYIHQYVICGLDGLAKNMLLATYDGVKWICGAYDMDATFLLYWDGSRFVSPKYRCPEDYQEPFSLLWERMETLFTQELKERYSQLRSRVYSFSNMVTQFERFMDSIGKELYAQDVEIYPDIPSGNMDHMTQIRNGIRDRLAYVDTQFANLGSGYLYRLPEAKVFDGTAVLDTGVQLFDSQKDFTLFLEMDCEAQQDADTQLPVLLCVGDDDQLFNIRYGGGQYWKVVQNDVSPTLEDIENGNWGHTWANTKIIVLVVENGALSHGKYLKKDDAAIRSIVPAAANTYVASEGFLTLGGKINSSTGEAVNCWAGTVKDFRIYERALSEEETADLINEAAQA